VEITLEEEVKTLANLRCADEYVARLHRASLEL
jgi:hypothetical protein